MELSEYIDNKLVHSIHTSGRKSFRGCRRRWNWIYNDYYYPTVSAKPLEFGVAFHKAMEAGYDPRVADQSFETRMYLAKVAFKEKVEEQKDAYVSRFGPMDSETALDYRDRVRLGLGMLDYYFKMVAPEADMGFKVYQVEIAFEVPIASPEGKQLWCKCNDCWRRYLAYYHSLNISPATNREVWVGLPVTYGGRIDMLAEDENGGIWIFDWKTAAQLTKEENSGFLAIEDQITSYLWALWTLDLDVRGFVYVEIKKGVPTEPEPNKQRRLGRLYSVSKSNDYDVEMYVNTVRENDPMAYHNGLYDEFIEYLENEGNNLFTFRHRQERNHEELIAAGQNIWLEASDMTDPNLRIYPNSGKFNCGNCAFYEPCLGTNRGEDVQYYLDSMYEKRTRHYYEDAEPSTDKRRTE